MQATAERPLAFGAWTVTPKVGVGASRVRYDGFSEFGAPVVGLTIDAKDQIGSVALYGVTADRSIRTSKGLNVRFSVEAQAAETLSGAAPSAAFLSAPELARVAPDDARSARRIGLGLDFDRDGPWKVGFSAAVGQAGAETAGEGLMRASYAW
jgi:uncharacterized protein with beta-barrel porin domain